MPASSPTLGRPHTGLFTELALKMTYWLAVVVAASPVAGSKRLAWCFGGVYLKGKDAESEEAQEHANSSSLALYA